MSQQEILPPPSGDDCICQQRDGESPDNDEWPEWLTNGCPVHDLGQRRLNERSHKCSGSSRLCGG